MRKNVLVIGGTRLFGIRVVQRLLDAGHRVTLATRGRAGDRFGDRVRRLRVDRSEHASMCSAFADVDGYDVVYDQVCYSAQDAEIALAVFAGRVERYVMASTIEVYRHLHGIVSRPFVEDDVELADHAVARGGSDYADGKRQAEDVFARNPALPVVRVRIGHVLAGPEDFTGRLASYVTGVCGHAPLRHSVGVAATSFVGIEEISAFLAWVGGSSFHGAINATSHAWSAVDLCQRVAAVLGQPALLEPVAGPVDPNQLSPFDYPARYEMSTARALAAGYRFDPDDGWLDEAIRQHVAA